ncbi:hypothetical protein [Sphingobium yanoikuyae]|uniref:hypothetical protein n=1 Tax=Sphingobium yanoikuyae TaxID=13690 RepID=UPI0028DCC01A|nr:hypothetical protein [Sphingobium yanoikuyae]
MFWHVDKLRPVWHLDYRRRAEGNMTVFKILTFVGAALGLILMISSLPMSAVAQTEAAAVALFLVVAPYCVHGVLYRSKKGDD